MSKEKESIQIDNFKSTADLTSNPGFQSSLSIASKSPQDEKPYNPFEHRDLAHPNSTIGSVVHLLKACLGTGLLAMPAAFKNSGLIIGIIGTLVSGLVCTHTVAIVVRTAQKLCVDLKKPALSFSETCGAALTMGPERLHKWSNTMRVAVDWSLSITYFSVLCVYVVFIGSSLKEVLDYYYPDALSIQGYCALTLVPLVLLCQIRNLKYLVPFSLIANVMVFVVFAITLYYLFVDLKPIGDREMVASVKSWPLFVSTAIFAMEGIGVVMPVENEMRNPKRFLGCPGVLNTAMGVTISLYCVVGFFGYVEYGDALKGSVTLNLPEDELLAQTAKLLMALVIFLSYALQFYVPMEMITRMRKGKESKYENLGQVVIRTVIVIITVCIAATFPNLEMVISFVGAVFFSTLGLLLPAMVDILYRWHSGFGPCNYVLWKDLIIAVVAIVALFSGAYVSVLGIIEDFSFDSHDVHDAIDSHNATLT